ncbi:MAG: hypothetical protein D6714_05430, partial [Bacteroidetes bacterium]
FSTKPTHEKTKNTGIRSPRPGTKTETFFTPKKSTSRAQTPFFPTKRTYEKPIIERLRSPRAKIEDEEIFPPKKSRNAH